MPFWLIPLAVAALGAGAGLQAGQQALARKKQEEAYAAFADRELLRQRQAQKDVTDQATENTREKFDKSRDEYTQRSIEQVNANTPQPSGAPATGTKTTERSLDAAILGKERQYRDKRIGARARLGSTGLTMQDRATGLREMGIRQGARASESRGEAAMTQEMVRRAASTNQWMQILGMALGTAGGLGLGAAGALKAAAIDKAMMAQALSAMQAQAAGMTGTALTPEMLRQALTLGPMSLY